MKLYLWEDVLCDYTSGVMFAIADTEEEARELILEIITDWSEDSAKKDLREPPEIIEGKFGFALWGGG